MFWKPAFRHLSIASMAVRALWRRLNSLSVAIVKSLYSHAEAVERERGKHFQIFTVIKSSGLASSVISWQ